jgi:hypothetical protein
MTGSVLSIVSRPGSTLGGQSGRRQVDPVNLGSLGRERELPSERGPTALASEEVDGRGRQDSRQRRWSAVFDPAPAEERRLRVDLDGPLDGQTTTRWSLEPQHERDRCAGTLAAHRRHPKARRLPIALLETFHQGTIRAASGQKGH